IRISIISAAFEAIAATLPSWAMRSRWPGPTPDLARGGRRQPPTSPARVRRELFRRGYDLCFRSCDRAKLGDGHVGLPDDECLPSHLRVVPSKSALRICPLRTRPRYGRGSFRRVTGP